MHGAWCTHHAHTLPACFLSGARHPVARTGAWHKPRVRVRVLQQQYAEIRPLIHGSTADERTAAVLVVAVEQARHVLPVDVEAERLKARRCRWHGAVELNGRMGRTGRSAPAVHEVRSSKCKARRSRESHYRCGRTAGTRPARQAGRRHTATRAGFGPAHRTRRGRAARCRSYHTASAPLLRLRLCGRATAPRAHFAARHGQAGRSGCSCAG